MSPESLRPRRGAFLAVPVLAMCLCGVAPVVLPGALAPVSVAHADDGDDGGGGGGGPAAGRASRTGGEGRGGFGTAGGDGGRLFRALRGFGFRAAGPRARPRQAAPRRAPPRLAAPAPRPVAPQRAAGEIVAAGLDAAGLAALTDQGFTVVLQADLALLPGTTARLRPPRGLSAEAALARVRALGPEVVADRNTLFFQRFLPASERRGTAPAVRDALELVVWPRQRSCVPTGAVGLIDTALDRDHPALRGRIASTERIVDAGGTPSQAEHGTAVAVLIAAAADTGEGGEPAPAAEAVMIHAIDAFHRRDGTDAADAFDLVRALDRLVGQGLRVINMSIAGPENLLLDRAGGAATDRGVAIVAAVGNDGPRAGPRYPAAYPWAVAVTAIDRDRGIYVRAGRGGHVDVAAPGVGLSVEDSRGRVRLRTGTSFAAPFVTAALALSLARKADRPLAEALTDITTAAADLGEPGPDGVFGAGLLQVAPLCR